MEYFRPEEAEQFSFIRIPRKMLTEKVFGNLSKESILLYGVLLDRMGMSKKNNWIDSENRVYVVFPIETITDTMLISRKKAIRILQELEEIGLIEKDRQGGRMPTRIYIKNFNTASLLSEV